MILKEKILELVREIMEEKNFFLVSLDVSSSNTIRLLIDSMEGIKISECAEISRAIEDGLNRNDEDFEIEVSSPGLGMPFKTKQQYVKNIGKEIEVITKDGHNLKGILIKANETEFGIEQEKKVKIESKKKKQVIKENLNFTYTNVSKVRNILK